jgi:hypothetical protein
LMPERVSSAKRIGRRKCRPIFLGFRGRLLTRG